MQIKNKHYFLALLAFLIFFVALFWFPLTHPQYIFDALDLKLVFSHWYNFMTSEIAQGRLPFWNPFVNNGTPFLAHPSSLLFYPVNWLYFLTPPGFALTLFTLFHFIFAAFSMYVLAFRHTKNSLASFASGITYAGSGYFAAKLYAGHNVVFASAAWLPLVFYYIEQICQTRQIRPISLIGGALAFTFLILCGFPENTAYFALFAGFTLFLLYGIKAVLPTMLIFIFGSLLSAFHLLPTMEFVRQTTRAAGMSFEQSVIFSLSIKDLPNLIIPNWFNQHIGGTYPLWEILNYLGIVSLVATLISILNIFHQLIRKMTVSLRSRSSCHCDPPAGGEAIFDNRDRHVLPQSGTPRYDNNNKLAFLFTGLLALFLSFGNNLPFHIYEYLWKIIPLFRLFRIPSHFLIWTTFCVSLLTGYGIALINKTSGRLARRSEYFAGVAVGLDANTNESGTPKIGQIFFVVAIVIDFFLFFRPYVRTTSQFRFPINQELLEFLETHKDSRFFHDYGSYTSWNNLMELFDPSAPISLRVESVKGSDTMLLKSYADFARVVNNQPIMPFSSGDIDVPITNVGSPLFNLLGAKYLMITNPTTDLASMDSKRFTLLKTTPAFRIYQNNDAMTQATLIYKVTPSTNVFEDMRSPAFNPQTEAIIDINDYQKLTSQPDLASKGEAFKAVPAEASERRRGSPSNNLVRVIQRDPQKTIFSVTTDIPALLLVTDVYYPGWQAKIDGKSTLLVKTDGTFRGILIPSGIHTVTMYYQPTIFILGAIISITTLTFLLLLLSINKLKHHSL